MARYERLYLKRKVAGARNDIETALSKIVWLYEQFEPVHPEYAQLLEAIAKGLLLNKSLLEDFWRLTWGKLPSRWDAYVGDGVRRDKDG